MRILVTGSRRWNHPAKLEEEILAAVRDAGASGVRVIVGDAVGGDTIAARFADLQGWPVEVYAAKWRECGPDCPPPDDHLRHSLKYGGEYCPEAGLRRNREMVAAGADLCLAFMRPCNRADHADRPVHPTHGSAHCAGLAETSGIPTRRIWDCS